MADYDWCVECGAYDDDYYLDENGNMICACDTCIHNRLDSDDD